MDNDYLLHDLVMRSRIGVYAVSEPWLGEWRAWTCRPPNRTYLVS